MAAGKVTTDSNVYRTYPLVAARKCVFTASTADQQLIPPGTGPNNGIKYLLGWRISEAAGAAAVCQLIDASEAVYDSNATHCGLITLAANGQDEVWYGPNGVLITTTGLWLHVISGSVSGVVYFTGG